MIVDLYTHMVNGKDFDTLIGVCGTPMKKALETARGIGSKRPQSYDVAARLAQMDRFGIDCHLATINSTLHPYRMSLDAATEIKGSRTVNDSMARLTEESKGRILCAGTVPFSALEQEGLKEMERAVKGLGLKGFAITTNIDGRPLDAPEFRVFWAKVVELGATVWLHPVDPIGARDRSYEADFDLMVTYGWPFETTLSLARMVFSGMMDEFPTLKVVTHHLGGMIPFYWGRLEEHYVQDFARKTVVSLKKPFKEYFSKFYYDTAVGNNPGAIRCCYEVFGADQIVLGTDAPYGPGTGDDRVEMCTQIIKGLGLPEKDTAKILGENARRILGI